MVTLNWRKCPFLPVRQVPKSNNKKKEEHQPFLFAAAAPKRQRVFAVGGLWRLRHGEDVCYDYGYDGNKKWNMLLLLVVVVVRNESNEKCLTRKPRAKSKPNETTCSLYEVFIYIYIYNTCTMLFYVCGAWCLQFLTISRLSLFRSLNTTIISKSRRPQKERLVTTERPAHAGGQKEWDVCKFIWHSHQSEKLWIRLNRKTCIKNDVRYRERNGSSLLLARIK